jgi:hypothetical protein
MTIFAVTVESVSTSGSWPNPRSGPALRVGDRRVWIDTTTNPAITDSTFENRVTEDGQIMQLSAPGAVYKVDMLFVRNPKMREV